MLDLQLASLRCERNAPKDREHFSAEPVDLRDQSILARSSFRQPLARQTREAQTGVLHFSRARGRARPHRARYGERRQSDRGAETGLGAFRKCREKLTTLPFPPARRGTESRAPPPRVRAHRANTRRRDAFAVVRDRRARAMRSIALDDGAPARLRRSDRTRTWRKIIPVGSRPIAIAASPHAASPRAARLTAPTNPSQNRLAPRSSRTARAGTPPTRSSSRPSSSSSVDTPDDARSSVDSNAST